MSMLISGLYLLVGVINIIAVVGVASRARLEQLYGVAVSSGDLEILLRHRAVLFLAVGLLLAVAGWHPPLRLAAALIGLLSMGSFIVIAQLVGQAGAPLQRVVIADVVGCVLLGTAVALAPPW